MTRFNLLASVAVISLTAPAVAQEAIDLDAIVVSGSLTPVDSDSTGATVEVLTGADAGGDDSALIDRLDRLPGVSSTANGGLGAQSSIQIRGLPSRYVSVLVNGIDVADPSGTQSAFNFGGLTSSGIARVEVLKGSQSALYGSEAIGGVVDIRTYRPETLGFSGEATAEAGSFDTYSGTLSLGYKTEQGEVALTYGRLRSDGISTRAGDAEDDGFDQTTITFSVDHTINEMFRVGGSVYYRDSEVEFDRSTTDNSGVNYATEQGARVFAELHTGIVTHTFSYSYFDVKRRDPGGFTVNFTGERRRLAYLGSADLSPVYTLNFGIDRTEEEFSADASTGAEDTTSAQLELLARPSDAVDLSAALRYDDNSTFGGKATGRIAGVWRPVDDLAIRAVLGTGFRTPSLYERFSLYGDPALQPETSRSFELGAEKTFGDLGFVKATLFYTEIDDLIDFDGASVACPSGFGCYNQVPGTTKSKGIELSGEYAVNQMLTVFGNYTYTDAQTNGARLTRTPRHDVVIGASSDFTDRLRGHVDLRHVAGMQASAFAPVGHKVGDYTLVGAGLSYDVTDSAAAYLRIENLFDEDYETTGGYNTPGRAAYFGIRAKF